MKSTRYNYFGRSFAGLLAFLAITSFSLSTVASRPVPQLKGHVNDYANLLTANQRNSLTTLLARYATGTGNQLVLLTIPSLEGEVLGDFSIRVVEKWQLGQKGKDNGVLFLIAVEERKARIEVGYGLEGTLTDLECSRIIRYMVIPAFKQGDYFRGIRDGLSAILSTASPEWLAQEGDKRPSPYRSSPQERTLGSGVLFLLMIFFFLFSRFGRLFFLGSALSGGMWGRRGIGGRGFGGFGGFSGGGGGFGGGGASGGW